MDLLQTMPNKEALKVLLDFSNKWTEGCREKWGGGLDATNEAGEVVEVSKKVEESYNVLQVAWSLKDEASVLAIMVPNVLQMSSFLRMPS